MGHLTKGITFLGDKAQVFHKGFPQFVKTANFVPGKAVCFK